MSKIRILSEKILINSFYSNKFINYSNTLTDVAKKSNGFISSKSYFVDNINLHKINDNPIKIITISEWKNIDAWNKWKNSQDRKNVSESFKDLERTEEFKILYDRTINDTFLL
tara:strand:- start:333 stop:671 length:339 start_codon:yes stop_codon:yes gene_type:complete